MSDRQAASMKQMTDLNFKNKAVFYFADSRGIGLTYHFSKIVVDLYNKMKDSADIDLYIISASDEQNEGLWEYVRYSIPENRILVYNSSSELIDKVNVVIQNYKCSLFQLHGLAHLKVYSEIKKRNKKQNLQSVIIIHSFRNGELFKRIAYSLLSTYIFISSKVSKVIFLSPSSVREFWGARILKRLHMTALIPFYIRPLEIVYPHGYDRDVVSDFESEDVFKIIYFANYFKNKGHSFIIEALKDICSRGEKKHVHVYFFGDGERKVKLQGLIAKYKLEENVFLQDRVDRKYVPWFLSKSNLAIVASRSETFGHSYLEPLSLGIPVIGTRVGCGEYMIQDYITGLGVDRNKKSVKLALNTYISMGQNREIVIPDFNNYDGMISAYYNLYSSLLTKK